MILIWNQLPFYFRRQKVVLVLFNNRTITLYPHYNKNITFILCKSLLIKCIFQERTKLNTIYYWLLGKIEDRKDILWMLECYESLRIHLTGTVDLDNIYPFALSLGGCCRSSHNIYQDLTTPHLSTQQTFLKHLRVWCVFSIFPRNPRDLLRSLNPGAVLNENQKFLYFIIYLLSLGLGVFLVERLFFPENERNDQERSHCSKKTNAWNAFLKILEQLVIEQNGTERELLEKNS